jgi:hypothetical protein
MRKITQQQMVNELHRLGEEAACGAQGFFALLRTKFWDGPADDAMDMAAAGRAEMSLIDRITKEERLMLIAFAIAILESGEVDRDESL